MPKSMSSFVALLKQTFKEWNEDKASRLAAALAYYTAFSIPPLLLIAIAIAGRVFGEAQAREQLIGYISSVISPSAAEVIAQALENADQPSGSLIATVVGLVVLLFGASGVFAQLQDAMNTVWDVAPAPNRGVTGIIKDRFLSFTMVLGVGFLLLVSLLLSSMLTLFDAWIATWFPGGQFLAQLINFVVSFGVVTLLFALIYKIIPDVVIKWRDVWIGAVVTAFLFSIGKWALGLYVGNAAPGSVYGAAGSILVLLAWVYYAAQILFFGAEFTQVYANRYGSEIVAAEGAVPLSDEQRVNQGIPRREQVEESAAQAAREKA